MGTTYKYKCNSCGFEKEYFIGGGFFTENYFRETQKLNKELKNDALEGKFGNIVKAVVKADTGNELFFSCGEQLFQCNGCKTIKIWWEKRIKSHWNSNNQYDLDIEIKQKCPECGDKGFNKIKNFAPLCPECKKETLELISLGRWDWKNI